MSNVDVSLIIPSYNEGYIFEGNILKIVSVLKKTKKAWEIIFVEDKGTDNTKLSIEKLVKEIPK